MIDSPTLCDQLCQELFAETTQTRRELYAVIDGAVHTRIHHLIKTKVATEDYSNLFHRTDFSDIEDAAPYLVRLREDNKSFLNKVWELNWGIFLTTWVDYEEIEAHLRLNLMAEDPLGEELLFRYYDPRVLPLFFESSSQQERRSFFGPIDEIHVFLEQEGYLENYSV